METLSPIADRLLGALGNGVVQGLIVATLVGIGMGVFGRPNAATRYAVRFVTLIVVAILPIVHGWGIRPGAAERAAGADPDPNREPVPPPEPTFSVAEVRDALPVATAIAIPPAIHLPFGTMSRTEVMRADESPLLVRFLAEHGVGTVPEATGDRPAATGDLASTAPTPTPGRGFRPGVWRLSLPPGVSLALLGTWLAVAGIRLGMLGIQCLRLRAMKRRAVPATGDGAGVFDALRAEIGVRRDVDLRISPRPGSPMVVGFRHPAILLPAGMAGAAPADLARVLRHELAHVRRRDDWTNLFQQAVRAVLFFDPAVLWLSRRLTVDREIACDDQVLSAPGSRKEYALFLAEFARRTRGRDWAAAPAAWSNPTQLQERIHMILDRHRNASPRLARTGVGAWALAALLIAAAGAVAAPRLELVAASADSDSATSVSSDSGSASVSVSTTTSASTSGSASVDSLAVPVKVPVVLTISASPDVAEPPEPPEPPEPAEPREIPSAPKIPKPPKPAKIRTGPEAPMVLIAPPRPPTPGVPRELEQRLARLEALVASLVGPGAEERRKPSVNANADFHYELKGPDDWKIKVKGQDGPKVKSKDSGSAGHPAVPGHDVFAREIEESVARIEKDVAEATANALAHAGAADGARKKELDKQMLEARRRSLDEERKVLRRQIAAMEAQIEKLEARVEQVDEQAERAEELRDKAQAERDHVQAERDRVNADRDRTRAKLEAEKEHIRQEAQRAREVADKARAREDADKVRDRERRSNEDSLPSSAPKVKASDGYAPPGSGADSKPGSGPAKS